MKCIIYINNVIIFSATVEKHKKDMREVLKRMREYEVIAKLRNAK